ncbi:MAG: tripartite tricarboxylate transporter TctB family protein [Gammaproteobacteria bacterium]|nr:tripartite tricarboxylate transporter TctB family protein [Gammaproteobacteria bacterium]MCY4218799.1 tripartite tricarboxylate transporter TctB family protein [Gammaproteobacteria bacterium]MCY4274998.1 tripartite tricarboxylate transporter TctB family protein [Gammaproteobacteria bacterium]
MRLLRMHESRLIGLVIVALGLFAFFALIPIGIVTPSNNKSLALAPDFWPRIIASVFILMGIILLISPARYELSSSVEQFCSIVQLTRLVLLFGILFGIYIATPQLGLVLPSMLMVFGLSWLAGERRCKLLIILSFFGPIALAVFFIHIANIPIPLGIFEFIYG